MAREWPIPLNSDLATKNISEMLYALYEGAATVIEEEKNKRVALQKEMATMAKQIENLKAMYEEKSVA